MLGGRRRALGRCPLIRRRGPHQPVAGLSLCAGRPRPRGLGALLGDGALEHVAQGRAAAWGGLQGTGLAVCPVLAFLDSELRGS